VLTIASAGWVFDTFEGQVFNITRKQMLAELLGTSGAPRAIGRWGDLLLAVFLVGGTLGGVAFGSLADRFGRKPVMAVTILVYSVFSGLTAFATELWQVAVLRFVCVAHGRPPIGREGPSLRRVRRGRIDGRLDVARPAGPRPRDGRRRSRATPAACRGRPRKAAACTYRSQTNLTRIYPRPLTLFDVEIIIKGGSRRSSIQGVRPFYTRP
jgi:hypothetical protein